MSRWQQESTHCTHTPATTQRRLNMHQPCAQRQHTGMFLC